MRLTCTQENFKKAIHSTERVVGRHISLPILENILLETEGGMLKVSATNLEIGVFLKVGAKIEQEGRITVPAKLLSSFVSNLPSDGAVDLFVEDQVLNVSSGNSKAQIKGLEAAEFPIIPEMNGQFLFSMPAASVKEHMPRLLACVSLDSARPELSGVNLSLEKGALTLAATDSFRLAEAMIPLKKEDVAAYDAFCEKTSSVIVPSATFAEVLRVIGAEAEEVKVSIEESQIFFQVGGVRIVSRLINGKYPEYRQIMPTSFETRVVVDKDDFLRAVKLAGMFAASKAGEVHFSISAEGVLKVASRAQDVGANTTELSVLLQGSAQEITFNPRYMLDGIQAMGTSQFALLINSSNAPAVLRMVGGESAAMDIPSFTYVIMPIKNS